MLKGKGGLLLFCSIPPAAPSVQLRSITSIMQHFREKGRCSLILARKLNFHSMIIYSFFGGIFPASRYRKPQKLNPGRLCGGFQALHLTVGMWGTLRTRHWAAEVAKMALGAVQRADCWVRTQQALGQAETHSFSGVFVRTSPFCITSPAFTRLVFGGRQKLHYKMSDWFKWPYYNKVRPWRTYKKVSLLREAAFFHAGFLLYDMLLLFFFTISHAGNKDIQ